VESYHALILNRLCSVLPVGDLIALSERSVTAQCLLVCYISLLLKSCTDAIRNSCTYCMT